MFVWKSNNNGQESLTDPNGGNSNEGGITDPNEEEEFATEGSSDGGI